MSEYVYIEYPKCLYDKSGKMVTVETQEEEIEQSVLGYMTAEKFYAVEPTVEPEKKPKK